MVELGTAYLGTNFNSSLSNSHFTVAYSVILNLNYSSRHCLCLYSSSRSDARFRPNILPFHARSTSPSSVRSTTRFRRFLGFLAPGLRQGLIQSSSTPAPHTRTSGLNARQVSSVSSPGPPSTARSDPRRSDSSDSPFYVNLL